MYIRQGLKSLKQGGGKLAVKHWGQVKLMENLPEIVPAGSTVVLNGYVQLWEPCMEKWITL